MSNKSKELVQSIIEAKDKKDAVNVMNQTLDLLHLTDNYTDIVEIKDKLEDYKKKFRSISDKYKGIENKTLEAIQEYRSKLNFLYRDINDEMTFEVNRLKIFYDEKKTVQRYESMESIKNNEDVQKNFNAKSASAIRDIVGADNGYKEYVALVSISYGLWQELKQVLESIRLMTDTMASESKREQAIRIKDVK